MWPAIAGGTIETHGYMYLNKRVPPCEKLLDLLPVHVCPRLPAAYQSFICRWPVLSVKHWLPSRADG